MQLPPPLRHDSRSPITPKKRGTMAHSTPDSDADWNAVTPSPTSPKEEPCDSSPDPKEELYDSEPTTPCSTISPTQALPIKLEINNPSPSGVNESRQYGVSSTSEIPTPYSEQPPYFALFAKTPPPTIVTVGCDIQPMIVHLDVDSDFFSGLSKTQLYLNVGLADSNDMTRVEGLQNGTGIGSRPPSLELNNGGKKVFRFPFFFSSLRVLKEGRFRFTYAVQIPGCDYTRPAFAVSKCFSTTFCPEFSSEEMEYLCEEQRKGNIRLRWEGKSIHIDVLETN
ncbi:hypothetical protein J7T55_012010 [Diaporthe amygdali]|uniref:uncharacterized protein n=1 Tax=Phomopsis amygdali TaxID=1214568 RepID=UPI0022FE5E8D|nr:uncharacterized protein J7T55_012010 [Diaporthe amygdali]KAJ0123545.1 hypothetical protein J7T55_012010 [Diaporthe amygdali]